MEVKVVGRWTGSLLMLANALAWTQLGSLWEGQPSFQLLFLILNTAFGYTLGFGYDQAKAAALRDELTQTYNRRALNERIPDLLARCQKRRSVVSVSLIDCDNFKQINDQHGHAVGDLVLKRVANLLLQNVRHTDYVIRFGGDEFLIVTGQDHKDCQAISERIALQLKELSKQMNLPISLSFGTATFPMEASRIDDLIRIADHKMYESKYAKKAAAIC